MPKRIYRANDLKKSCRKCTEGIYRFESLVGDLLTECPACQSPIHVAIVPETAATIGAMDPRLATNPVYMSQFVEPGDPSPRTNPRNYISGPHSWRKMVDQKQREGFRVLTNAEISEERSPREIKRSERNGK